MAATKSLVKRISVLHTSGLSSVVALRLAEFKKMGGSSNEDWFSELCFCILTANSRARTAMSIQEELGYQGFHVLPKGEIAKCIRRNRHRFHNNKAAYIVAARKHAKIKDAIIGNPDPRAWLVENIKGLGWKEASHFLRNVGFTGYAIVDRHVMGILREHSLIKEKYKSLTKARYLQIESVLAGLCKTMRMSQAELDLYLWYMKTGEVLK